MGGGAKNSTQTAAPSGERRQVTVLFADMVGFVEVSERIGEDATFSLIRQIYELLTAAIKDQGGWAKDFTGDGVMALFGASEALEDAPLRACRSGLSIHQRLAAAASTFESQYGSRPQMRIGVNSGLAVVARIFSQDAAVTALGDTVNLASRLQKLAEPGTVYLSESTRRLVEGQAETVFAGEFDIKGKSEPQKVYRLDSVRPGATRFETSVFRGLSAYVGRERELQLLERSLADARQKVCIIDVVAEPGMGKSRLLYEFRRRLSDGRAFLLQGSCSPDGRQTPFRTFIEVVRDLFQVSIAEPENEVRRKLEQGLAGLELNSAQSYGLLLNMIGLKPPDGALTGLDGVLIGMRTREMLQRLLEARCRRSPVALLIEDIHWIDRASEEVLSRIASDDSRLGLLILHTRRPEYLRRPAEGGDPSPGEGARRQRRARRCIRRHLESDCAGGNLPRDCRELGKALVARPDAQPRRDRDRQAPRRRARPRLARTGPRQQTGARAGRPESAHRPRRRLAARTEAAIRRGPATPPLGARRG